MMLPGEPRSEAIEAMRGISSPCEEDVTADSDQTNCAPSGARPEILCFSLDFDFDLHRRGQSGM
jgi:hypothetical protein